MNRSNFELEELHKPDKELWRLQNSHHGLLHPVDGFCDDFLLDCYAPAQEVFSRTKQVLECVLRYQRQSLSLQEWEQLLPSWFVQSFRKGFVHPTEEFHVWDGLEDWLYWFGPEIRQWWWWDGYALNNQKLYIVLDTQAEPIGLADLEMLLLSSGGSRFCYYFDAMNSDDSK